MWLSDDIELLKKFTHIAGTSKVCLTVTVKSVYTCNLRNAQVQISEICKVLQLELFYYKNCNWQYIYYKNCNWQYITKH